MSGVAYKRIIYGGTLTNRWKNSSPMGYSKSRIIWFLDVVPVAVYTINELIWPWQGWSTALYFFATYILLTIHLIITIFALRIIYVRAKDLSAVQSNQVCLSKEMSGL